MVLANLVPTNVWGVSLPLKPQHWWWLRATSIVLKLLLLSYHCVGCHACPPFGSLCCSGPTQLSTPSPAWLPCILQAACPPDARKGLWLRPRTRQQDPILGQRWMRTPILQRGLLGSREWSCSLLLRQLPEETWSLSLSLNQEAFGPGSEGESWYWGERSEDPGSRRTSLEAEINQLSWLSTHNPSPNPA